MNRFEDFSRRAAQGGIVPVTREVLLDGDTPVSAFQKLWLAAFPWPPMRDCAISLAISTYQLDNDMMARMSSVVRATQSPCCHNARRP